jgi:uncharacterized membrane protein
LINIVNNYLVVFKAFFGILIISWSSLCHFAALMAFFYVTRKATSHVQNLKKLRDEDEVAAEHYDILRIIANGFIPFLYSILYLFDCGSGDRPIEFNSNYNIQANKYAVSILGEHLVC